MGSPSHKDVEHELALKPSEVGGEYRTVMGILGQCEKGWTRESILYRVGVVRTLPHHRPSPQLQYLNFRSDSIAVM